MCEAKRRRIKLVYFFPFFAFCLLPFPALDAGCEDDSASRDWLIQALLYWCHRSSWSHGASRL